MQDGKVVKIIDINYVRYVSKIGIFSNKINRLFSVRKSVQIYD